MWLRRAFYRWLIPAAFVLPLWLVIGWIVFGASAWALLWVFISAPIVLAWQLILTLLVRARGTVRASGTVSWMDIGVIGVWHLLIVGLGTFGDGWWWLTLLATVLVGFTGLWTSLWQLWREAKPSPIVLRTPDGVGYVPAPAPRAPRGSTDDVIVIHERTPPPAA
ncbi:MFS transporter permease [Microbacterium sp.]|uniref:MFS transporter permease n=1 Tax=Microbacterium sp. TaxID=51671 RepID=UPI0039E40AAD